MNSIEESIQGVKNVKRIANYAALAVLIFLACRVAGLEQREQEMLRALRLTERNVEKLVSLGRFFYS